MTAGPIADLPPDASTDREGGAPMLRLARLTRHALQTPAVLIVSTRGGAPELLAAAGAAPRGARELADVLETATLAVPVHDDGGEVVGVICCVDAPTRAWSAEERAMLRDAAVTLGELLVAVAVAGALEGRRELTREAECMGGWGSWEWDVGGRVRVSEGMWRIVGMAPQQTTLDFDEWLARVHRDDRPAVMEAIDRTLADGGPRELRHRIVRAGGEVRTLSARLRRRHDAGRARLVGVSRDVTTDEAAVAALRASEARYRALFEQNPLPALIYAPDTLDILDVNEAAVAHYGWSREELLRLTIADLRPPEDVPALHETLGRLDGGAGTSRRVRHRRRDGSIVHMDVHGQAVQLVGRAARLVIAQDVSERVAAEQALRASEARFRAFVEQANDALFVLDDAGIITYMSPSITLLLGYDAAAMIGTSVFAYVHEHDRAAARELLVQLLAGSDVDRAEVRVRDAAGGWREMEALGRALSAEEGEGGMAGTLVSVRDISERRRTEAALRESEARFRSLVASSPLGVFLTDAAGAVTFANPRAQELWGATEAELMGAGWAAAVHAEDREGLVRAWEQSVAAQRDFQAEYRIVLPDGSQRWVQEVARPLHDAAGRHAGAVNMVEDVSARRELEAQLRQAQKMEAVGQLAGGIAHDFNNLLTVIQAHCEFLLEQIPEGDPARADASEIGRAASRAASLTRQLLAFSRKQLLRPRSLDVNDILGEMGPMLHRLLGEDVSVVLQPSPAPVLVRADPGQLEQVLMNLAVNARDAMPAGGTITVATGQRRLAEPLPHEHGVVPAGDYVTLEVDDTGTGMPDHVRQRAFEPFFTTKGPGKGTGLGLATVYGIVRQSGGHVTLESEEGRGTRFRVYLPVMERAPALTPVAPGMPAARGCTILLVEDEAPLRALARRMLERRGHVVLEATDSRHALELAREHQGIDLLLTDVVMPGMNGRELSELVTAERPSIRTIFMSGYTDDVIVRRGALSPRLVLLHKPFTAEELAEAVARVMS